MTAILDWASNNPEAALALLVALTNVAIEAVRKVAPNVAQSLGGLSPVYVRAIVDGIRRALEARRKSPPALPPGTSALLLSLVTGAAGALGCGASMRDVESAIEASRDVAAIAEPCLVAAKQREEQMCGGEAECIESVRAAFAPAAHAFDAMHRAWCLLSPQSEGCQ